MRQKRFSLRGSLTDRSTAVKATIVTTYLLRQTRLNSSFAIITIIIKIVVTGPQNLGSTRSPTPFQQLHQYDVFLHAQFSTSHTTDTPPPSRASAKINSALREHCPLFTTGRARLAKIGNSSNFSGTGYRSALWRKNVARRLRVFTGLLGLLGIMPHDRKLKGCSCVAVSQMLTQQASFEKRTRCWTRMQNRSPARPVRCPTNELTTTVGAAVQGSDIFRCARAVRKAEIKCRRLNRIGAFVPW